MARLKRSETEHAMKRLALSQDDLAFQIGLSLRQLSRIMNGHSTELATIELIEEALNSPGKLCYPPSTLDSILGLEWNANNMKKKAERLAANGLRYEVYSIPSVVYQDRRGRLKRYDVSRLSTMAKKRVKAVLTRHPEIALRMKHNRHIALHITSGHDEAESCWWVLDEEVKGETFASLVASNQIETRRLVSIMERVAEALDALHNQNVIRRELLPDSIHIKSDTGQPILTDFELSKLLEEVPTVSPQKAWPQSPYLATEVSSGGTVSPSADWFSWANVFIFGLQGNPAGDMQERISAIAESGLSSQLRKVLADCVSIDPRRRPQLKSIISALKSQAKKG